MSSKVSSRDRLLPTLLVVSVIVCCLEVEVSAPGFPAMSHFFHTSAGGIQLTIALNFIGFFISGLIYGPWSENAGRRLPMITGCGLMALGATGCVFAPNLPLLLVSRFIQGLGAGAPAVLAFTIITDRYESTKAVQLLGWMNGLISALMVGAPILGTLINNAIGWRGNYTVIAVMSLLAWLWVLQSLPETKDIKQKRAFDWITVRQDYSQLLSSLKFWATSATPSLIYACYLAFVSSGAFLYTQAFKLSYTAYAAHQAAILGSFSISSFFAKAVTARFKDLSIVIAVTLIGTLSIFQLTFLAFGDPNPIAITALMMIFCGGFAQFYPIVFNASLQLFPEIKGTASGAVMSMRTLLTAGIVTTSGYAYNGHLLSIAIVLLCTMLVVALLCLYLVQDPNFLSEPDKK